jgi:hypothetical protein
MISSRALTLSAGKGRPLLIQVNQDPSIFLSRYWPETVMPVLSPQVRYEEVNGPSTHFSWIVSRDSRYG